MQIFWCIRAGRSTWLPMTVLSFTTHVEVQILKNKVLETHSRQKEGRRDYFATDVDYYESM